MNDEQVQAGQDKKEAGMQLHAENQFHGQALYMWICSNERAPICYKILQL